MTRKTSTDLRKGNGWGNGLVEWEEDGTVYISVVFSWHLDKALLRYVELLSQGKSVRIGGPAARYAGVSDDSCSGALVRHNPDACITSYGCPNKCGFCINRDVDLVELDDYKLRRVVCDDNLTATSRKHFDGVVDGLKRFSGVDINQGISASIITDHQASRLAELDMSCVRVAWDSIEYESKFMRGWDTLRRAGFPRSKISVYVLIGYEDTPEDALYRLEMVRRLGGVPFPMRYQPLKTKKRNDYVGENWTHKELVRYCRYWSNLRVTNRIPFSEFRYETGSGAK